jgi:hypothetical protein
LPAEHFPSAGFLSAEHFASSAFLSAEHFASAAFLSAEHFASAAFFSAEHFVSWSEAEAVSGRETKAPTVKTPKTTLASLEKILLFAILFNFSIRLIASQAASGKWPAIICQEQNRPQRELLTIHQRKKLKQQMKTIPDLKSGQRD